MLQEQRRVYYDRDLELEAYQLSGIVQKFPNHFHEYYVVGFVEGGKRHLWCKGREYDLTTGDLVLFNPQDNHYCSPVDGEPLDYRAINLQPSVLRRMVRALTGRETTPFFPTPVVRQSDLIGSVGALYDAIVDHAPRLEKEEAFCFLVEQLLSECAEPDRADATGPDRQIQALCDYMESHYSENISLGDLAAMTSFGASYLLRLFTRQVGVSPYRYLQTVRINRAKQLLENGIAPIDAAATAGFSDQSHFTKFFKDFIGLTPKQYQRIFAEPASLAPEGVSI